ncbi:MAG: hypothetical protein MJ211_14175 [Bacteroidales bacterium]|nr:hypothetical protein [Bacteroidales bacterium]
MITDSMNLIDIFNQILGEQKWISYWINKYLPKVTKLFSKQFQFPVYHYEKIKSNKTNNEYWILYTKENRNSEIKYGLYLKHISENYLYIFEYGYTSEINEEKTKTIAVAGFNVYTGHFLSRYQERFLKKNNLSTEEILGEYKANNPYVVNLKLSNEILKDYKEKYGNFSRINRIKSGYCFVDSGIQEDDRPIEKYVTNKVSADIYNTFITDSMLTKTQLNGLKKAELDYANDFYNNISELRELDMYKNNEDLKRLQMKTAQNIIIQKMIK